MEKEKLKQELLSFFAKNPNQAFTVKEIVKQLGMDQAGQFKFVVQALAQLEHDHQISLDENGAFMQPEKTEKATYPGIFHANDRGFGFVTIDPEKPDVFVNPTQTKSALNGDKVEVKLTSLGDEKQGRSPEGKIVKILSHSLSQVVGEFQADPTLGAGVIGSVKLKDKKLAKYQFLVTDKGLHPVSGEVILADITAYPEETQGDTLEGVALKVIGNVNDPGMDILQIVYQHDIPTEFPDAVMEQVAQIPNEVTEEEKVGRVDLTEQDLVTIDSIESKDLDDAVNVWKLPNGNYHLGEIGRAHV